MIAQIMTCFGWWGLFSTLMWLAAGAACALCLRREPRRRNFAWALGLAAAGLLLARVQVAWEQSIILDRTEELREVRQAQQKVQVREEQERLMQGDRVVRFAEDAPGESAGAAILTADELTGRSGVPGTAPSYQSGGRQARSAGKVDAQGAKLAYAALQGGAGSEPEPARTLKLAEYRLAGRLSHINNLFAELVLLAVLGIAVGDYLRRFNHPVDGYLPLPIAGTWLTHFSHGPSLLHWPDATDAQLQVFLEDIVRRGQTFLYVGDRPVVGASTLHRFRLGCCRAWSLPVLTWGCEGTPAEAEFALDAVWFNRYALCVPTEAADQLLPALQELLTGRAAVHATAANLPHLIWDTRRPIEPPTMQRLARCCSRTGLRLVLIGGELPESIAGVFLRMP